MKPNCSNCVYGKGENICGYLFDQPQTMLTPIYDCEFVPKVDIEKLDTCPHCNYNHHQDEGTSEMHEDGTCIIWCASCGKEYGYKAYDVQVNVSEY